MQRRALKQLGKVTQWTNEKVFSGEKTQLSDDFTEYEKQIEVHRLGIERLHATSIPFFQQITKVTPTADPYPPAGSGKDKILHTEALGLVMIDYGGDAGDTYGDGLAKYGRARCKLASAQEEFGARLSDGYIAGMEAALAAVNDYKTFRKKLDSRRLALDSAISRAQGAKKDTRQLEEDVNVAQMRFDEVEEDTQSRMQGIQANEERQWTDLTDLLEAELDYFAKCRDILEELRESWPTGSVPSRPRAKSSAFSRSVTRNTSARPLRSSHASDESDHTPNRSRAHSNASSTGKAKEKRSMISSFGSFGKKAGKPSVGSRKSFVKDRYGNIDEDDDREALHSDHEDAPSSRDQIGFRDSLALDNEPPRMRRTHTTALSGAKYVKALYHFPGTGADELPLRLGQVIEIQKQVSEDWWIGESQGRSGLFPSSYCEEYVPSPVSRAMPPIPRRTVPPQTVPTSPVLDLTSDSEPSHDFSDPEQYITAPLAAPAPSRPVEKPAPPPPPSRRSASSNNIPSAPSAYLSPPQPAHARPRANTASPQPTLDSSPEGSPFAGSDDEDIHNGVPSPAQGSVASGLSNHHLQQDAAPQVDCGTCGCEFTQNVFKAKGMCSTCYHLH